MSADRNKAMVARSGIDPGMKRLSRLHAIRSRRQKQLETAKANYVDALESIENYWESVQAAIKAKEEAA